MAKKRKKRRFSKIKWTWRVLALLGLLFFVNGVYQFLSKPTEFIGLFDKYFYKTPAKTWSSYGALFKSHETTDIPAELLAALAQIESGGNPIARTYWTVNFTSWDKFYAPASSSAGLFQMTVPTYRDAKKFCIRNKKVVTQGPWYRFDKCWLNSIYSRLWPSHSIEMTSARLQYYIDATLEKVRRRKVSKRIKRRLAGVIHLCGVKVGERFAKRGFKADSVNRCGSHHVESYLNKVEKYVRTFSRLANKS